MMDPKQEVVQKRPFIPAKNIVGYGLSLILTFAAIILGTAHVLSFGEVIIALMVLAVLQIAVQLFFFMHLMESDGPAYHVIGLILGLIFTFAIVVGSLWVMTFNSMVH